MAEISAAPDEPRSQPGEDLTSKEARAILKLGRTKYYGAVADGSLITRKEGTLNMHRPCDVEAYRANRPLRKPTKPRK